MAEAAQTETEVTPVADAPAPATEDEIDKLLAEFDAATQAPTEPVETVQNQREIDIANRLSADAYRVQAEVDNRRAELEQQQRQLQAEYDARDEAAAITEIRGGLSSEFFDDAMVNAWLVSKAQKDNRIAEAWLGRAQNPRSYNAVVGKLASDFQSQYGRLIESREAAADHEAVAQAMRNQGGKVPPEPPPNVGRMGTEEYRRHVRDTYGYDPSV